MNILLLLLIIGLLIYVIIKLFRGSVKSSAVQNAFLAKYTYQRLSDSQKKEVKKQTIDILRRGGMLEEDFESMCEIVRFSFIALAMNELDIKPSLKNEQWHYVKNPYMALHNSDHQVEVIKKVFLKRHNVNIEMEKFKDISEMYKNK